MMKFVCCVFLVLLLYVYYIIYGDVGHNFYLEHMVCRFEDIFYKVGTVNQAVYLFPEIFLVVFILYSLVTLFDRALDTMFQFRGLLKFLQVLVICLSAKFFLNIIGNDIFFGFI